MVADVPKIITVPATTPIDEILDILSREGVIVLSDYISEEEVDAMNAEALPEFEIALREGQPKHLADSKVPFRQPNTDVIYGLVGRVPQASAKVLQHPVWHAIMGHYLNGSSWDWLGDEKAYRRHSYWLHTTNGYRVRPGAGNQVLHRDEVANCLQRSGPNSEQTMIASFIAGTNVTERNGGTHVIPRSHLWAQDRHPTQEETVAVEMKKGSAAFWMGSLCHGAGANTCSDNEPDSQRIIYGYFGVRDTLRQGETGILAAPPEVVRDMPPEVLRLIGYYRSTSNLGGLRGKDPVDTYKPLAGYKEKWSSVQVA